MRRLTLGLVVVLALSLVAVAQDFPRMEVNAGYSFQRIQTGTLTSFTSVNSSGFGGGAGFNFTKNFALVADLSYAKITKKDYPDAKVTSFMFGPKFTYRGEARLSPFARFLVGAMSHGDNYPGGTPTEPSQVWAAETKWAFGFGGGVDARVNDLVSLRVAQVDYLRSHFGNYHQNHFRLGMGIVIKFGNVTK